MIKPNNTVLTINLSLNTGLIGRFKETLTKQTLKLVIFLLTLISIISFFYFYYNGLGLAYNDARSHLDIGRRVVEGLKPGMAQLGSVWLPLLHLLIVPTVWNDFMWHSGLSGSLVSMISFVITGAIIYRFLEKLKVNLLGRLFGVFVFASNINILYLQSTAMTELLLLATMTAGVYELVKWHQDESILSLIKASFWIMLSTLVRYDGWFLLLIAEGLIIFHVLKNNSYKINLLTYRKTEGVILLFSTLAALGIALWFLWNQLIFKDALYFVFGPYSAHAQQEILQQAGNLTTKGNLWLSIKFYLFALVYNSGAFTTILGLMGLVLFYWEKGISSNVKFAMLALLAPLIFNIVALYLGHSVLYIQGLSGNTWFNVRYGVMMVPSIAIFAGFLVQKLHSLRFGIIGLLIFVTLFAFNSRDSVTIDDAQVGASQKNVTEVSQWLKDNAKNKDGFVLISVASHDAIIFSSGLPMKKFIHEGTGTYYDNAIAHPIYWARWIVMRTNDSSDTTFKLLKNNPEFTDYRLINSYPFADIYQLKDQYLAQLNTQPILPQQK